ncbi:hypothetical protein AB3G45_23340 [Shinella sp. S4-D37]|uniref:hypothetical protein n=1 Tax=Shinella sp. S4-D37 TaxID=3161999 RepID=UPI00346752A2
MSSAIRNVDFNPASNRILNQMLHKAGYVTGRMTPLSGPLAEQSRAVLRRFMVAVVDRSGERTPPGPKTGVAYGQS